MKRTVASVFCADGVVCPVELHEGADGALFVGGSAAPPGVTPRLAVALYAGALGWEWTDVRLEGEAPPTAASAALADPASAATQAFDAIAALCGCPEWGYPAQVVRDVRGVVAERDALLRVIDDPYACAAAVPEADLRAYLIAHGWTYLGFEDDDTLLGERIRRRDRFGAPTASVVELVAGAPLTLQPFLTVAESEGRAVQRLLAAFMAAPCRAALAAPLAPAARRVGTVRIVADPSSPDGMRAEVQVGAAPACRCCPRAGECSGRGAGPRVFACPKGCLCHE